MRDRPAAGRATVCAENIDLQERVRPCRQVDTTPLQRYPHLIPVLAKL